MEKKFFSWESKDSYEDCTVFYDIVLKQQIGKFLSGMKFSYAVINFDQERGILQLWNGGRLLGEFELSYQIGNQIQDCRC